MYNEIHNEKITLRIMRDNKPKSVLFKNLRAGDIILKGQCRTSDFDITVAEDARCLQDENFPSWVVYDTIGIGHFPDEFGAPVSRVVGADLRCESMVCVHNRNGICEIPALVLIDGNGVCGRKQDRYSLEMVEDTIFAITTVIAHYNGKLTTGEEFGAVDGKWINSADMRDLDPLYVAEHVRCWARDFLSKTFDPGKYMKDVEDFTLQKIAETWGVDFDRYHRYRPD